MRTRVEETGKGGGCHDRPVVLQPFFVRVRAFGVSGKSELITSQWNICDRKLKVRQTNTQERAFTFPSHGAGLPVSRELL